MTKSSLFYCKIKYGVFIFQNQILMNVCGTPVKISAPVPTLPDPTHAHALRSGQDKIVTLVNVILYKTWSYFLNYIMSMFTLTACTIYNFKIMVKVKSLLVWYIIRYTIQWKGSSNISLQHDRDLFLLSKWLWILPKQ